MSAARPTRQRKAPQRFDDDEKYFDPPPTKRQPKEKQAIVEVVMAPTPVIAVPAPPAVKEEPGVPRKRVYPKCGVHQECDCMEIRRKSFFFFMRNKKTPEKIESAAPKKIDAPKRSESMDPKKMDTPKQTKSVAPKKTGKENRAPLAAVGNIKTHHVRRLIGG